MSEIVYTEESRGAASWDTPVTRPTRVTHVEMEIPPEGQGHIPHRYNPNDNFSHITNITIFGFNLQNVICDVGKAHNVNIKAQIIRTHNL
jgi:hypothetical protein